MSIELVMVAGKKRILLGSLNMKIDFKERTRMLATAPNIALTKQEGRIKELMVEGLSHKEAANRLNMSLRVVVFHASNIYRKYGVADRNELLRVLRHNDDTVVNK